MHVYIHTFSCIQITFESFILILSCTVDVGHVHSTASIDIVKVEVQIERLGTRLKQDSRQTLVTPVSTRYIIPIGSMYGLFTYIFG